MSAERVDRAGMVVADATRPGFPLIYLSPGFETLTGYTSHQMIGRSCALLQGSDTDPRAVDVLRQALVEGREAHVTLLNYRADGTPFWNEVALAPQRDNAGRVVQFLGVQKDVSARRRSEARIHELVHCDPLTGLANRAAMQDAVERAIDQAARTTGEVALLLIDIDDFKRVNDAHGHLAADALLAAVAQRLRLLLRTTDLAARMGADEFLILLEHASDVSTLAADLAARLVDGLHGPYEVEQLGPVPVAVSIGVSPSRGDVATARDLLRHANAALSVAKGAGKNGFHVHRERAPRLTLAGEEKFDPGQATDELARILATKSVRTVFQPIVELRTGRVVGYEALARGPQGSALESPVRLYVTAHAAGRVEELDWLCRATAVAAALEAGLDRSASLFLNLEPTAIGTPCPEHHAAIWARAMTELSLVFELTERALTDRPAELAQAIEEQRAAGYGIALDDLGADVHSLALLPLVEPDVIKLDLRLVQDRPSTDQAAIVSTVAAERERTGAAILAEGIETSSHLSVARSLGATLGQGWMWGRPGPLPPAASPGAPTVGRLPRRTALRRRPGLTPFEVVAAERPSTAATKALLLPMSHHLENQALQIGEGAVVLSAFQAARHFTPATVRRYETLVRGASLVAAFGVGLGEEPAAGVRGASLVSDDTLAGEWSVIVLGPHFAGALVAKDLGDAGRDLDRRFRFATVYERGLVIAAARTLLARIVPVAIGPALIA